jgi:hypothetical protein
MEHTVRDGKTLNSIIIYWSWTAQGQGKWYLNVILYPDTRTYQVLRFLLKWLYHVLRGFFHNGFYALYLFFLSCALWINSWALSPLFATFWRFL